MGVVLADAVYLLSDDTGELVLINRFFVSRELEEKLVILELLVLVVVETLPKDVLRGQQRLLDPCSGVIFIILIFLV